jgi:hypothetical protein
LSFLQTEIPAKRLEILKEVVPALTRIVPLGNPANAGNASRLPYAHDTARTLGMRLQPLVGRGDFFEATLSPQVGHLGLRIGPNPRRVEGSLSLIR